MENFDEGKTRAGWKFFMKIFGGRWKLMKRENALMEINIVLMMIDIIFPSSIRKELSAFSKLKAIITMNEEEGNMKKTWKVYGLKVDVKS